MKVCEFLLQKEGDRVWLPIESPTVEILEGRYRIVARTRRPQAEILVEVSYWSPEEMPPKRRTRHWNRRTNEKGVMPVLPFTTLRSGNWQIQCSSDLLADMGNDGWKQTIALRVLAQDDDFGESDEQRVHPSEYSETQGFAGERSAHYDQTTNQPPDRESDDLNTSTTSTIVESGDLKNNQDNNNEVTEAIVPEKYLLTNNPHPPAPSPKKGEGEPDQSSSPNLGEGFRVRAEKTIAGTEITETALHEFFDHQPEDSIQAVPVVPEESVLPASPLTATIASPVNESVSNPTPHPTPQSVATSAATLEQLRELAEAMSQLVVDTVLEATAIEDSPKLDETETVDFFTLSTPESDLLAESAEGWADSTIEAIDLPEPLTGLPFVLPDSLQGVRLQLLQNTIVPGADGLFRLEGQILTATGERLIVSPLPLQARVMLQNPNNMETRLALTYLIAPNPVEQPLQLSGHIALDWKNQLLLGEVLLQALSLSVDDLSEFVYVLTSQTFTVMPSVDALLTQVATGEGNLAGRSEWDFDQDFLSDDTTPAPIPAAKTRISADFLEVARRSSSHLAPTPLPSSSEPSESLKPISPIIASTITTATNRKTPSALDLPDFLKSSSSELSNPEPAAPDFPETIAFFTSEEPEQLALLDLNEWTDPNIPSPSPSTPADAPRKPVLELPHLPSPTDTLNTDTPDTDTLNFDSLDPDLNPLDDSQPHPTVELLLDGIPFALKESQESQDFQEKELTIDFEIQAPTAEDWFETALAPEQPDPQTWAVGDLAPWENANPEITPDQITPDQLDQPLTQPINEFVDPFVDPGNPETEPEELPLHLTLDQMPLDLNTSPNPDRSLRPLSALTNILSSLGVSSLIPVPSAETSPGITSPPEIDPAEIDPVGNSPALSAPDSTIDSVPDSALDSTPNEDDSTFQALMDIFVPEEPEAFTETPLELEESISSDRIYSPNEIPLALDLPTSLPLSPDLPAPDLPAPDLLTPDLPDLSRSEETSQPLRVVGEFFDEFEPTPQTQNDRSLSDPALDSFFSEPIASPSLRLDSDEDLLDLSLPLPDHLRLAEDSAPKHPDRLTEPFIPEPWRWEVVVEDEWLEPDKRHWMSLRSPTPTPCLPKDTPIPVPSIDISSETLIAGEPVTLTVRLPHTPSHLLVKVWMLDCQSRTLAADPCWIRQFLPTLPGFIEAIVHLTVPLGCLEIQLEAMTIEPASQRESHKFSVVRAIVPSDLNDLAPLSSGTSGGTSGISGEVDRSDDNPNLDHLSTEF